MEKPQDHQECLVKMQRGIHQATYCKRSNSFASYLYGEIVFYGREWIPIEELPGYQLNQK